MTTNDATPREADRAVPEPDADAVERAAKAMYMMRPLSDGIKGQAYYRAMARTALAAVPTEQAADRSFGSEHHQSLIQAIWKGLESSQASRFNNSGIAHRIADHVEGWLLERQAAAGDDLDELLDSVHPRCVIKAHVINAVNGLHSIIIWHPDTDGVYYHEQYEYIGTGPTRIAAIKNAVEKAKETQQ